MLAESIRHFTPEHIQSFLKCQEDPNYFIENFVTIQHPTKGNIPFDLYDYQSDAIDVIDNNKFSIIEMDRQKGKTTTIAAYLFWYAMFHCDQTIAIISTSMGMSKEIMYRIRNMYEYCDDYIKAGCVEYNQTTVSFENGSRIIARPLSEYSLRGLSVSILFIDEMAFMNNKKATAFWTSIMPVLSTGGKCIVASTPNPDLSSDSTFNRLVEGAKQNNNGFVSYVAK